MRKAKRDDGSAILFGVPHMWSTEKYLACRDPGSNAEVISVSRPYKRDGVTNTFTANQHPPQRLWRVWQDGPARLLLGILAPRSGEEARHLKHTQHQISS